MINLILTELYKAYGGKELLNGFSLTLRGTSRYVLTGASGRGKTTLLRILTGLEAPDSGTVCYTRCAEDGSSCEVLTSPKDIRFSAVFQEDRLCEDFSAVQNVRLCTKQSKEAVTAALRELLPDADLKQTVRHLSGGQRRRVALVRALLADDAEVLVLDEPFTGLDAKTKQSAIRCIEKYLAGRLLILVTHDAEDANALSAETVALC